MNKNLFLLLLLIIPSSAYGEDIPVEGTKGSERIQEIIKLGIQKNGEEGVATMIFSNGKVAAAVFAGYRDKAKTKRVDEFTRIRIGSISKQLLAISILQLVCKKKLDLDGKVLPILTETCGVKPFGGRLADARFKDITIRMLLEHQGGWDRILSKDDPISRESLIGVEMGKNVPIGNDNFVSYILGKVPLQRNPGTFYHYSNVGYALLVPIVVKLGSSISYSEYVYKNIIEPAGITRDDFCPTVRQISGVPLPERVMEYNEEVTGIRLDTQLSVGGWEATAPALTKLLATFFFGSNGKNPILPFEFVNEMVKRPTNEYKPEDPKWFYGLGFLVTPFPDGVSGIMNVGHGGLIGKQFEAGWSLIWGQHLMIVLTVDDKLDHPDSAFTNDFITPIEKEMLRPLGAQLDYTSRYFNKKKVVDAHNK